MNARFSFAFVIIAAFTGVISMAAESPKPNEITWSSATPGQMNPAPPARLIYNAKTAIGYSWGRRFNRLGDDGAIVPVGKYEIQLTESLKDSIKVMEEALAENFHTIPKPQPHGTGMSFGINYAGKYYNGYANGGLTEKFAKSLWPIADLYSEAVLHGKPIAAFVSIIHVTQIDANFTVTLTFKNIGREPVTLAGPATWANNPNMLPLPHVRVFGYANHGIAFVFALSKADFLGDDADAEKFTINPGKSTDLTFSIPLASAEAVDAFKGKTIDGQTFEYDGQIKINILEPDDLRGTAIIYAPSQTHTASQ